MVPRGCWSYAPRHQSRTKTHDPMRAAVSFRDQELFGTSEDRRSLYRRAFDSAKIDKFNKKWITGWSASGNSRKGETAWPSQRLAEGAAWKSAIFEDKQSGTVEAMVTASNGIYLATSTGTLRRFSKAEGKPEAQVKIPVPLWDGLAIAGGRIYVSTRDGKILCLGE